MHRPGARSLCGLHTNPVSQTPAMFQGPPQLSPSTLAHTVQQPQGSSVVPPRDEPLITKEIKCDSSLFLFMAMSRKP